jgi:uncharacterized protein DUF6055
LKRNILVTTLIGVAALLAPAAASASGTPSHADAVRALQNAKSAFAEPLSTAVSPDRDATVALRNLAVALPALSGADKREAQGLLSRPTDKSDRNYFGKEAAGSPVCDANFCVHWTDVKQNAPESEAFLGEVEQSIAFSYGVENGVLGWQKAKSDGTKGARNGVGGDGQVDVYITNLGKRLYGYAAPDPRQKGSRRYAYLVLDNDYKGFPSSPLNSLKVTVAHEYNHILQFNYDTYQDTWLFEDTATWMEEQVYPEINDYLNYLPAFARGSQTPMTGTDIKIYSEAVFNHWLSGHYGQQVIRDVWAASEAGVKPAHLATAAYTAGTTQNGGAAFSDEFGSFAAATAEWQSSPYFPDHTVYPEVRRKGTLGKNPQQVVLDNTSFRLVNVKAGSGPVTLKVKAQRGTASTIALVARTGPVDAGTVTPVVKQLPKGGKGTVTLPAGSYDRVTAAIINSDGRTRGFRQGQRVYTGDNSKYKYSLG